VRPRPGAAPITLIIGPFEPAPVRLAIAHDARRDDARYAPAGLSSNTCACPTTAIRTRVPVAGAWLLG
jgi:hypothetical protein